MRGQGCHRRYVALRASRYAFPHRARRVFLTQTMDNFNDNSTSAIRLRSETFARRVSLRVSIRSGLFAGLCGGAPPHSTTQAAPEAGNETHVWHYFRSGQSGLSARSPRRHLPSSCRSEAGARYFSACLNSIDALRGLLLPCVLLHTGNFTISRICFSRARLMEIFKKHVLSLDQPIRRQSRLANLA